jgi:hypothetical protein
MRRSAESLAPGGKAGSFRKVVLLKVAASSEVHPETSAAPMDREQRRGSARPSLRIAAARARRVAAVRCGAVRCGAGGG